MPPDAYRFQTRFRACGKVEWWIAQRLSKTYSPRLHLGTPLEDHDLTAELRTHFKVPDSADLTAVLQSRLPGEVLAAIGVAVAPVAVMVRQLYEWLGRVPSARATGNLTVRAGGDDLREMSLDPRRYAKYERQTVESVASAVFRPS